MYFTIAKKRRIQHFKLTFFNNHIVYIFFIYELHIYSLDEKLCVGHLPKFYGKAVKCWQNEKEEVLETVTSVLKVCLISYICLIF